MADFLIDLNAFSEGLQVLGDSVDAPVGSARIMSNVMITDRGGISPRPGTSVLGAFNTDNHPCVGFYDFVTSGVQTEIPIKSYNGRIEYINPSTSLWTLLQNGYTLGAEFGFKEFVRESDFSNVLCFANGQDSYSQWNGVLEATTATLSGSETSVPIGSTLKPLIFDGGTSSVDLNFTATSTDWNGSSWAQINVSGGLGVATNAFTYCQVLITSGTLNGQTFGISTNGTTGIVTGGGSVNPGSTFTFTVLKHGTTFLNDTTKSWTANQWSLGTGTLFFIHITSGPQKGQIAQITSNSALGTLIFSSGLPGDPGASCTYDIRQLKFNYNGTVMVNGTAVGYNLITTDSNLPLGGAIGFAVPSGSPVTQIPDVISTLLVGNRLETYLTKMLMAGVPETHSVTLNTTSGTPQNTSGATMYVSYKGDATKFTFATSNGSRLAGEGDFVVVPYGGGNIVDICSQEDGVYVGKSYYLAKVTYDPVSDLGTETPLKQDYGLQNKFIKTRDDIYFVTTDNQITSIGRVALKDTLPQTTNIGLIIKRLIDGFDFSKVRGIEFKQRIFIACKNNSLTNYNNRVLVYNLQNKAFEGLWNLNVFDFEIIDGNLYYAESSSSNVFQMFSGSNDSRDTLYPVQAKWGSNWIHLVPRRSRFRVKPSQFAIQGVNSMGLEGYIKDGSQFTFSLYKDLDDKNAVLQFQFGILPGDENYMKPAVLTNFLGANPLGITPIGSISDTDPSGRRHFKFVFYFPDIYSNYLAFDIDSNGQDADYEINRVGLGTAEDSLQSSSNIESINNEIITS